MAGSDEELDVPAPLRDCLAHCEVHCVADCCGVGAFSSEAEDVRAWCVKAGPAAARRALQQLAAMIAVVNDRSRRVSVPYLNQCAFDDASRKELLDFLEAFAMTLHASIAPAASP
jgi:hypothetical protein